MTQYASISFINFFSSSNSVLTLFFIKVPQNIYLTFQTKCLEPNLTIPRSKILPDRYP